MKFPETSGGFHEQEENRLFSVVSVFVLSHVLNCIESALNYLENNYPFVVIKPSSFPLAFCLWGISLLVNICNKGQIFCLTGGPDNTRVDKIGSIECMNCVVILGSHLARIV